MGKNRPDTVQTQFYDMVGARRRQNNNPAETTTEFIQFMIERIVGELCVNRFNWQNLPDSLDTRFMEVTLYHRALVVVFEDMRTGKLLAANATPSTGYDMNNNPLSYTLIPGQSGTLPAHLRGLTLSARNVVPIWGNAFRIPDYDIVAFYSQRLAQTERTIDVNLKAARRTKVLAYNENTRLTVENINRMLENGDAAIPVDLSMADLKEMISVLDLEVHPEHIERLSIVRDRFWNNLMGLLGINNANQDKKERLVEAEVSGNDDQVDNFRRINLNWRQKAAEQMSKKWPIHFPEPAKVDYYTNLDAERPRDMFPDEMGGDENADIYPRAVESA